MKVAFVRGAYLNNFEGQNYNLDKKTFQISGYSSLWPIDSHVPFSVIKLPSPADLQKFPLCNKPIKYIANRTLGDSQLLWRLESHIQDADIVHVADPHYFYAYQAAVLKAHGQIKKLVSTWWETIPFNNESVSAKKRIKKYTMEYVDVFLCYSEKAKRCLLTEGIKPQRICVIPLGVDLSRFQNTERTATKKKQILFVGRLVEEKGVLDLYDAFRVLVKKLDYVHLKIVGDGQLKKTLKHRIHNDNLQEKVSIIHKSYQEMPDVYKDADIFCLPSKKTATWEEQYGMVFVEAMACGLPIISYKNGAITELVGEAGIFVKEEESELTASLLSLSTDRHKRTKIGTMGEARAKKLFDSAKTARAIENLYLTVLKNNE